MTTYFTLGNPPVGKSTETTALLVPSAEVTFKPLVDMLKEQQARDGVTTTGKPVAVPRSNDSGQKCKKCETIGEELWMCPVRTFSKLGNCFVNLGTL